MSGGSFNYVCHKLAMGEVAEVAAARYDLRQMADAMAAEGYPEAAAPLAAIVARIDALDAWAQGLTRDGIYDLTKAFEWWQSGDYGKDAFERALAAYLEGRPPATYAGDEQ